MLVYLLKLNMYSLTIRRLVNKFTFDSINIHSVSDNAIIIKYMKIKSILDDKPLGRWSLEYGKNADKRSNLANVDHCGTCQTYKY
jgi:hypothetical protein